MTLLLTLISLALCAAARIRYLNRRRRLDAWWHAAPTSLKRRIEGEP
jgi:hypothetical protein